MQSWFTKIGNAYLKIVATGGRDVETQSLLGSAYKDLCEYSTSEESKFRYADLAIARYEEAYNAQRKEFR